MILVKFEWDVGRMGIVEGLFATTQLALDISMGKEVYFGEILGKHSEICGVLEKDDFTIMSNNVELIQELLSIFGNTLSGYNPLDYIEDEDEEDEEMD